MAATAIDGKNPLKNQKADDLETWYVALGVLGQPSLFKYDPRLTLTYLASNLLHNIFKWEFFGKVDFLILLKPKTLFLLDMLNLMRQWL